MLVELRLVEQRYQAVLGVLNDGATAVPRAAATSACRSKAWAVRSLADGHRRVLQAQRAAQTLMAVRPSPP